MQEIFNQTSFQDQGNPPPDQCNPSPDQGALAEETETRKALSIVF